VHGLPRHSGAWLWWTILLDRDVAAHAHDFFRKSRFTCTYAAGGKQYVVIAAGGGKEGSKASDEFVAFALA
jgi:glucose dehydrogenase